MNALKETWKDYKRMLTVVLYAVVLIGSLVVPNILIGINFSDPVWLGLLLIIIYDFIWLFVAMYLFNIKD